MSATLDPRRREAARLAELDRLEAMRPEADRVLQELVDDAREVFGTEFCLVNLVTSDTQYFRAWSGDLPSELAEVKRNPSGPSMCRYVVEDERPFVVEDFSTTEQAKVRRLSMGPGVRFYAGTPLKTSGGHAIGSFCVLDGRPREFGEKDTATLRAFAKAVVGRLEALGAAAHEREAKESERRYRRNVFELANDAILIYGAETGLILDANRRACEMYGIPQETLVGKKIFELSSEPKEEYSQELLDRGSHLGFETVHRRADGTHIHVSINSSVTEYGGQRAILSINRDVTGRRQAEEKIRRSEARNNAILDASPDLMFLLDRAGEFLDYKAAGNEARLYVPTEGIVGRKVGDLMPAEIAETALHLIARALDTGELQVHEYRLSMQDGPRDFEARLVKSGTNEVLCIVHDVTERKRTEAALRLSEKRLAQAQRITHTGNWEHELGKNRTHWSDEMYRIFGLTPLSLVPSYKTFMLFVHPDDRERVRGSIRGALHGDGPEDIEYRIVRPDGEVRFVNTQYEAAYDESGRPTKFFGTVQDVTDRKRVEQNLGEAEERYRTLVEQIPAVAYIDRADVADVPFYTSPRIEALLGYTPEEWLGGRLWLERLHPDDRDWVLEADTRARAAEEPFGEEYRLIDRDGRVVWVCDESVLLRDEAGRPLLWQGVLLDITERKRAEEALRRSEERFRSLIQNAPDVIMVLDADSTILYDSPSIQRVLGYDPGERIGSKGFDYVHPEDLGRAKRTFVEVLTNPVIEAPVEYRLRHKDGSWRDFEATRTNLLDDPAVGGVVINCRDVTEHKRFEEALRQSEARFRTIFERSAMGISIADPDRKLLETNRAYQDMLGYNREELLGKSIADISHPEDVPEDEELNGSLLAGDRDSYRTEKRYVRKDGGSIWARPTVSAVRDARGEPQFLIGMVEDITERKRWEERLREAEKKYRTLVERIPAVTYVQEATGPKTVTYVSPQIETVLGYAPEEYISDPDHWAKILHPEDKERVLAEGKRADETGEPYKTEYRQFARDGRVVWMRDEAALVRDEEDAPSYWLGVKTDITERREAEAALRESEERFQRLADAAFEGIIVHDGGEVLEANTAYAAMHGREVSEIVGRSALEWAAPEYRTLVRQHILAGHEEPYESVEMKKDGTRIDVEIRGKAISYQGRAVRVAAVRDITERKRAEAALRESEERYRLVAKATNEVIWDNDLATGKQLWDGAVQTMFGYSPEELGEEGRWWEERIHPDDRRRVLPRLEALLGGDGELWTEEYRFRRQDGAYATVVDRAYVVRDVGGKPVRMLGSMMDITERKRTEEELEESRRRLSALLSNAPAYLYRCRNEPGWPNEFVSDYALELTGYTPEELTDGSVMFADLIVGADRGRVWDELQAALSARRGFESRYSLRRKDGEIRHVEERGRGLHGEGAVAAAIEGVVYDVTERVRAEERLGEAEERYRTLVEQIPAVTYIDSVDDPDTSLYTSPQIEELLGYSPEEWQNERLWSKRLHPEDRERVLAADERFESGGEPFREEYRLLARDGSVVWVREEAVLISNEAGEPLCWQGVMFDVTERRRTEEALHASEVRLRTVIEQSPLGIHIFAPDGTSLLANGAWDRLWCLDDGELGHANIFEDEQLRSAGLIEHIERSVAEGDAIIVAPLLFDPAEVGREGSPRWLRALIYPVRGEDGHVLETVLLLEDVTERKRAEDALKESEKRYKAVVEQSAEAIWLFDPDTKRVLEANAAFQEMLGYDAEELRGMTNYGFVDHSREDVDRAVMRKLQDEKTHREERKYRMKDGTLLDVEVGGTVISYRGKNVICSVARDITERKRIEGEMRETNRRLGELATLRADFTAMVAHEIGAPLATIRGFAEMLETGELGSAEQANVLTKIETEIEGLATLVADVRSAAAIEREDFSLAPRPVPVGDLIEDAARFAETLRGDHQFIIEDAVGDEKMRVDPYRIGQVLRNLLSNAAKHSPEGAPIKLCTHWEANSGRIRVEVVDRGRGVHPDDTERIFEKFGRGREADGRHSYGIGLGLYLSGRIVRAHGGELTYSPAPRGGSVFSFDLEVAQ